MASFYTILTDIGQAKVANAIALGQTIEITHLAVGDGGGSSPTPDSSAIALVNEMRRAAINRVDVDSKNPSWVIVEQIIPPDVGGWTIREVGIFDAVGDLIGYGNYPETYKPVLDEGSSRTQTVRFVLEVSDTAAVTLKVDPSVVLATRQYVDDLREDLAADSGGDLVTITSEGTEALVEPDTLTASELARRVAYMEPTQVAIGPSLTSGGNIVPLTSLEGDSMDPERRGFIVKVIRAGAVVTLADQAWSYDKSTGELTVEAQEGDRLLAVEREQGGHVTTSTGTQTVTEALDNRVIYVDTIADLQAIDTSLLNDQQVFMITSDDSTGYVFDAGSEVAANGYSVVAPETGSGRFILVPSGKFKHVKIKDPSGTSANLLFQNPYPGATRIHIEPNGNVDSGTVTKLDLMLDPFDEDSENYRIWNLYTQNGDPYGTGEPGIIGFNAKGTGNHWGTWPTVHFGFQDLGAEAVCAKMWYGDHNQPQHYTPHLGAWREGRAVTAGDYVTASNKIYQAATTGTTGATVPSHTSGTVSDGSVEWDHVYSPSYTTVRPTLMIGDRSDMPTLGHPDCRLQVMRSMMLGWGATFRFVDDSGASLGDIRASATSNGSNKWINLNTGGGGYIRFHGSENYFQSIGLAKTHNRTLAADGATSVNVEGVTLIHLNNSSLTSLTALTGGKPGQEVKITVSNDNTNLAHNDTATSGGVLKIKGGAHISPADRFAVYTAIRDSNADFWRIS